MPRANASASLPASMVWFVYSMTRRAVEMASLIACKSTAAPTSNVSPFMIMASSVVWHISSGDPPQPTVPSHCASSHAETPFSTALNASSVLTNTLHASLVATVKGHVFTTTGIPTPELELFSSSSSLAATPRWKEIPHLHTARRAQVNFRKDKDILY